MIFGIYILFLFSIILQPGIFWMQLEPLRIVLILGGVCIFFFFLKLLQGKSEKVLDSIGMSLLVFIIIQVISNIRVWMMSVIDSFLFWGKIAAIYFLGVGLIDNVSKAKKMVWAFMMPGLFIGVVGIYNYFYRPDWMRVWDIRTGSYGFYANSNDLTHLMILIFPFFFKEFESRRNLFMKTFLIISMGFIIFVSFLAVSRAGLIGLFLVIFLSILTSKTFNKIFKIALFLIFFISAAVYIPQRVLQRAEYKESKDLTELSDRSIQGRRVAWWRARQLFKQHPILGIGDGQFKQYYKMNVHNIYFTILAEKGFPGFITFLFLVFFIFKSILKVRRFRDSERGSMEFNTILLAQAVGISMIGYLWHGIFANKEKEYVFYMLITLSSIVGNIVERTLAKKEEEEVHLPES